MGAGEEKPVGRGVKSAISGILGFLFALSIYYYNGTSDPHYSGTSSPYRPDHDLKEAGLAFVVSFAVIYGVISVAWRERPPRR